MADMRRAAKGPAEAGPGASEPGPIAFWHGMGIDDTLPMELVVSILRAHQLLWNRIGDVLKPLDLGVTRFPALGAILDAEGGCRLSDLSSAIQVHPTTITVMVDQLTKQGLVKRVPHATDRRSTLAVITPAGAALLREAYASLERMGFGVPALSRPKLKRLVQLLGELRAELDDVWPDDPEDV
jgi:DNA-binding MarR family transcriptional regulator